jgi:uncharacterized cupredoxin-like copper-binding protein
MGALNQPPSEHGEERETYERVALPLLVPAAVFLFAVLVIYGLSRIYLELDTYHVGDVSMATPLAIGVALGILGIAAYFASRSRVPRWQVGSVMLFAVAALTAGSIWAAVHEERVEGGEPTPPPNGMETPGPGLAVALTEYAVTPAQASAPAGSVTFQVENAGGQIHNFRVITSDLDAGSLPIIADEFVVDEDAVDVVGSLAEFEPGVTMELALDLEAGPYVLICNVPGHYESGMHAAFEVTAP